MFENIYYRTLDGKYHSEFSVRNAFYLATGMKEDDFPAKYQKWVEFRCQRGYFVKYAQHEIEITAALHKRQPALAAMLYREKNGGTLKEAHDTLKAMFGEN